MSWFDYVALGVIVFFGLISLSRGFVKEFISLIIWIVGLIIAFKFAPLLHEQIRRLFSVELSGYIASFVLIFVGTWLLGLFIASLLKPVTSHATVGSPDRLLSGLCGALKGFLLVSVFLMFANVSSLKDTQMMQDSFFVPHFQQSVAKIDCISAWARSVGG